MTKTEATELLKVLRLAERWLANCVPTVPLDGPTPLPVIAAAIEQLEAVAARPPEEPTP